MEKNLTGIIVLIPSFNEARTIGRLVKRVKEMQLHVLVVDDGSHDETKTEAAANGAEVIRNDKNMGKGYAIRDGINHILKKGNYKFVIIMDGDGQHHPDDIVGLINKAISEDLDMVVGNRMTDTVKMPLVRYLTNRLTSWVITLLSGIYVPDSQCGFRLIKTDVLKTINLISDRYDIESEMLIETGRSHFSIASAPVRTIYSGEVSKINPARDTIRFIKLVVRYLFKKQG
jgi:glycosyltransferase involved in cell wall biosynthesis